MVERKNIFLNLKSNLEKIFFTGFCCFHRLYPGDKEEEKDGRPSYTSRLLYNIIKGKMEGKEGKGKPIHI